MTLVVLLNFKFNLELVETAAMSSVQTAKKLLRSNMKKTLNALSQEEIQNQSKCVFDQVSSNPLFQNAAVISCYLSMPTAELNTNNIVRSILREGTICIVQFRTYLDKYSHKARYFLSQGSTLRGERLIC